MRFKWSKYRRFWTSSSLFHRCGGNKSRVLTTTIGTTMLRRKRSSATTVASAATSSSSCPAGIVSAEESLDELRISLDRLEYLLTKISLSPPPNSSSGSGADPTKESLDEDEEVKADGVGVLFHVLPTFMAVESADENEIIEF